jgi:sugar phosphate isomerase/epimerase
MFFGAPVWPCQWHPPYQEAIKRIAGLGFEGVELIAWTKDVLTDYYTPGQIRELTDLIRSEGLVLTNFYHGPPNTGAADAAARTDAFDGVKRAIDVAAALGSPLLAGTAPYPFAIDVPHLLTRPTTQEWVVDVPDGLDWTRNYDDYVDGLRGVCALAKRAGLRYAIEPHPFRWVCSAQSMLRLVERTGADNLGMNLDPSHLFPSGEIPHYTAYMLGPRVFHTHFSDNDGQSNAHWRPGKGKVDWSAVLRALREVGYDGVLSLELEDVRGSGRRDRPSGPHLDLELKRAVAYLTALADEEGISTKKRE